MLAMLLQGMNGLRAWRVGRQSRYRAAMADLPPTLYPFWKRSAAFEFKGIPQDVFFFARAAEGLLAFFDCVRQSGKPCALPSKAADSVWHAWEKMAPADLAAFCKKHYGRSIPHVEAAGMRTDMVGALATSLVQSRAAEGLDPAGLNVPKLFSLDRRLGMPGGYAYRLAGGKFAFSNMDGAGKPLGDLRYPAALAAASLLAAGLVTQQAYDETLRKQQDTGGSSCGSTGSSCGSSASDSRCDGSSSDGCDSGGSSCGSSCGGGGGD
jgi:hypothetical protein